MKVGPPRLIDESLPTWAWILFAVLVASLVVLCGLGLAGVKALQ